MSYIFALALYAKGFSSYAVTFLPPGSGSIWGNIFATGIILIFTAINFTGARAVGRSELFIVSIVTCNYYLFLPEFPNIKRINLNP